MMEKTSSGPSPLDGPFSAPGLEFLSFEPVHLAVSRKTPSSGSVRGPEEAWKPSPWEPGQVTYEEYKAIGTSCRKCCSLFI